jgi:glycosyltransferase involved in cell wall biosynthesis
MTTINARVGLQQRVLPEYRAPFFNELGKACLQGLSVFAGLPRPNEAIATVNSLGAAQFQRARNLHLFSGKAYFCHQRGLMRWLELLRPQVLIVEANPRYLSNPFAIQWMHHRHLPVIGWGLGATPARRTETLLRGKLLSTLDAMITYSQTGADQYIAAGFDPKKVFVAPNAVSPRPKSPPPQRSQDFAGDVPTLLFVGRLQERKRIDLLLRACQALSSAIQPRLVIVGDGPDRAHLEAIAKKHYPTAQFVGAKHGIELEPYFNSADLFVLPGTGGLAVQQAMAHALPVIVGEADGTQAELVRPVNGWLLPSSSVETLRECLSSALQDVPRLRRMGEASYRIVAEEVNLENMVDAFARAISAVL